MSSLIQVEGFDQLVAGIRAIANDRSKRREALVLLRALANPTVKMAKSLAPKNKKGKPNMVRGQKIQPGNLKKSIGVITGRAENPTIYVGPRVKSSNKGWYGAIVEAGHNVYRNEANRGARLRNGSRKSVLARVTKKRGGAIASRVEGQFFMRRTSSAMVGPATAEAETKFAQFIQRRIDRMNRS